MVPHPSKQRTSRTKAPFAILIALTAGAAFGAATPAAGASAFEAQTPFVDDAAEEAYAIVALIESVGQENKTKACTTVTGQCIFECEAGDTIYVWVSGRGYYWGEAACGGTGVGCSGLGQLASSCADESDYPARADDVGICRAGQLAPVISGRPLVSCAAAPAETNAL